MNFLFRSTITATYLERIKTDPHQVAYRFKPTHPEMGTVGSWNQWTFRDFDQRVRESSFGLMGIGLQRGDRAAILSNTRIEWTVADIAILGAGGVTVPIYASNTPEDVAYILNHSEAKIVFVEDPRQLEKVLEKRDQLPHLQKIACFDPAALKLAAGNPDILSFAALRELGKREEARDPGRFEKFCLDAKPSDLVTICYTSGTTGVPKGVMLSHDNVMSVLEDCVAVLGKHVLPGGERLVTFLPFSHIIGKLESLASFPFGWEACYAESLDRLIPNLVELRPTVMFAVPRIFEKAHGRVRDAIEQGSATKQRLFEWAMRAGRAYFEEVWAHREPSRRQKLQYALAQRLVLRKVAARLGGRLRFAICGGAPLPKEIGEFFQIAGITILEGYGLTETSAPVALMTPEDVRFGRVGRPLPESVIKIAEDGEILVKSRKVFSGYFKMPTETAEVMENGWFHTGDIGQIDKDGFLQITDRKKDLIITSGGKNVAPQKIENLAKSQKFISHFVVHGDKRHYLTALVTLDKEGVTQYATEHQILFSSFEDLVQKPKIQALAQNAVDAVNRQLASFETIKRFVIIPHEFTIEGGELTPSLKIKRKAVNQKYKAELDSLYVS